MKDEIMKSYMNERHRVREEEVPEKDLKEKLKLAQNVLQDKLQSEKRKLETETAIKVENMK